MSDAVTMQDFRTLLKSETKDPLLEALRKLTKLEDPKEVSDTKILALWVWCW